MYSGTLDAVSNRALFRFVRDFVHDDTKESLARWLMHAMPRFRQNGPTAWC
jgi:hypothetical protein